MMIDETISRLEKKIKETGLVSGDHETELLGLVNELKAEITDLSRSRVEQAESIAGFAERSAYEATREDKDPELFDLSVKALSASVRDVETSHPELTRIVNSICMMLSNIGI